MAEGELVNRRIGRKLLPRTRAPGLLALTMAVAVALLVALQPMPRARAQGFLSNFNKAEQRQEDVKTAGIIAHRGARMPLNLHFKNARGQTVTLGQYFNHTRPAILMLVYFRCPYLCGKALIGVTQLINKVGLKLGHDYTIVTVSFDPTDTPAMATQKKNALVPLIKPSLRKYAANWHFLTGNRANIHQLTSTIGFRYEYFAAAKIYNHSAGIFIMTPGGKLSQFLSGVSYNPTTVKISLLKAGHGKIGSFLDQALAFCCSWNPNASKYGPAVQHLIELVGGGTVVGMVALIGGLLLWERRHKKRNIVIASGAVT